MATVVYNRTLNICLCLLHTSSESYELELYQFIMPLMENFEAGLNPLGAINWGIIWRWLKTSDQQGHECPDLGRCWVPPTRPVTSGTFSTSKHQNATAFSRALMWISEKRLKALCHLGSQASWCIYLTLSAHCICVRANEIFKRVIDGQEGGGLYNGSCYIQNVLLISKQRLTPTTAVRQQTAVPAPAVVTTRLYLAIQISFMFSSINGTTPGFHQRGESGR